MQTLSTIKHILKKPFSNSQSQTNPEEAYDIWAASYDSQPDNLMLALDEQLFAELIKDINLLGKKIVDVGCGTGRHWQKLFAGKPLKLIGYDVSEGMLAMLKKKFPNSETNKLNNNRLAALPNKSVDIIISTLTVAHIQNLKEAFAEWNRVLKPEGEIIITDYHPDLLAKGGNRTFRHNDKLIAVKNNIYPILEIKKIAIQLGWEISQILEKRIDDSMKHYYEKQNALNLFERYKGTPIIYGSHLKKLNVIA